MTVRVSDTAKMALLEGNSKGMFSTTKKKGTRLHFDSIHIDPKGCVAFMLKDTVVGSMEIMGYKPWLDTHIVGFEGAMKVTVTR